MLYFENDYCEGAHPAILQKLMETNFEKVSGYGTDPYCASAREKIRAACACPEADVSFISGGTQTNAIVIASMLHRWEGVIAASTGHVAGHEAGAIEYTGHKVLGLPHENGKLAAATVREFCQTFFADGNHDHMVFPGMVYISHPTEGGTLYSKAELTALYEVCRKCGLPLFIGTNLQQYAFNFLDAGKVGFITALYMLLVPLFGLFLGQKVRPRIWVGVALGVVGLYFLSIKKGDFSIGKGEIVTIVCSVAFAVHILVIDHFCKKVNNVALSCAQFFVSGIISVICMFIFEEPKMDAIISAGVPLLYAGIMSCGGAFTLQIFGQKYAEPAVASILLCLESVFSVIFGWLILHQRLSSRELFGCAVMFIAIIITQLPERKKQLRSA